MLYLGHVISAGSITPDVAKLRDLVNWPIPTTILELQSFFGFGNFNNKFIDEQTALTSSLYDLTGARNGTEPVQSLPAHVNAFNKIKHHLCAAPRLAHRNLEAPFTLYTDASKIAIDAVLLRRDVTGV